MPHKRLHIESVICDYCGEKTDIYMTVGSANYCSQDCKELHDRQIFFGKRDSDAADKYDHLRDMELEDDSLNPNRY